MGAKRSKCLNNLYLLLFRDNRWKLCQQSQSEYNLANAFRKTYLQNYPLACNHYIQDPGKNQLDQ